MLTVYRKTYIAVLRRPIYDTVRFIDSETTYGYFRYIEASLVQVIIALLTSYLLE